MPESRTYARPQYRTRKAPERLVSPLRLCICIFRWDFSTDTRGDLTKYPHPWALIDIDDSKEATLRIAMDARSPELHIPSSRVKESNCYYWHLGNVSRRRTVISYDTVTIQCAGGTSQGTLSRTL